MFTIRQGAAFCECQGHVTAFPNKATYEGSDSRYHSILQGIYTVHHIHYKCHTGRG